MQFDGHPRGVEQRPRPHGGRLTALENDQVLRAYNPGMAGRAGQNPHRTGKKAELQSQYRRDSFSWERPPA